MPMVILFCSDAKTLITGSEDWTVRWWNLATGQEMLLQTDVRLVSHFGCSGTGHLVLQDRNSLIHVLRPPSLSQVHASLTQSGIQARAGF